MNIFIEKKVQKLLVCR